MNRDKWRDRERKRKIKGKETKKETVKVQLIEISGEIEREREK